MDPAQVLLNSLPAGATLQVGFPKGGEAASDLLIDFYDVSASNWLELPAVDSGLDLRLLCRCRELPSSASKIK